MASHNDLGKFGEELGRKYLIETKFELLHLNWKHSYYEIDIIASKEGTLHFIEIKTRRSERFGQPEEAVDRKKFQRLMIAAEEFLYQFPSWKRVQYDILSIYIGKNNQPDFFFMEDVYL